uniref:Ig-like domain-containing protein n=1 Tax=Seriola dumerili TaxID=41447 RepID=A0A3B4UBN8_SERDU
ILNFLLLCGILCKEWKVDYQLKNICAVKGSSVVIPCSFDHPYNKKVQSVMWGHERNNFYEGPFIFNSKSVDNTSRFQYIGDTINNCSFRVDQVEHNDTGKYVFRFEMNLPDDKWTGIGGSKLDIVDLKTLVTKTNGNGTMKEGDSVNLTCINSCNGGDLSSAFTWFKNGKAISEGRALYLSNISSTTSGNYTCSITTHKGTSSEVININVEREYWTQDQYFKKQRNLRQRKLILQCTRCLNELNSCITEALSVLILSCHFDLHNTDTQM